MQFDEDDERIMVPLASSLAHLALQLFPPSLLCAGNTYLRHCSTSQALSNAQRNELVHVIHDAMGHMYRAHKGRQWPEEKALELLEPGLVFVWYALDSQVAAFVAFKKVQEHCKALYLYEIQVRPQYQGALWGRSLMAAFHALAVLANANASGGLPQCEHLETEQTSLTVFGDNSRAYDWYSRMGYVLAPGSPQDRRLRSGAVIRPDYYLLTRQLT